MSFMWFVSKETLRAIYVIKNSTNKSAAVFPEQMAALLNESRTR